MEWELNNNLIITKADKGNTVVLIDMAIIHVYVKIIGHHNINFNYI